jgi:alkylation response protein AidB-like acyl-CoA dehydrogenase
VLEEMGRALLCAPYFATAVLAAGAVMNAGTEAEKHALLPGIASGKTTATCLGRGQRALGSRGHGSDRDRRKR